MRCEELVKRRKTSTAPGSGGPPAQALLRGGSSRSVYQQRLRSSGHCQVLLRNQVRGIQFLAELLWFRDARLGDVFFFERAPMVCAT